MTTNAELKAIREHLAVPTDWLAARMGVTAQTVWKYERPSRGNKPIPEHASATLAELLYARQLAECRAEAVFQTDTSQVVFWYLDGDEWRARFPEFQGWPDSAQGPFVAAVMLAAGAPCEFVQADTE